MASEATLQQVAHRPRAAAAQVIYRRGREERGRERGEREKEGGKEERTRGVRRNSNARHEEQAGRQAMFLENELSEVRVAKS